MLLVDDFTEFNAAYLVIVYPNYLICCTKIFLFLVNNIARTFWKVSLDVVLLGIHWLFGGIFIELLSKFVPVGSIVQSFA